MTDAVRLKRCPRCQQEKPLDAFYGDARQGDGASSRCKSCDREAQRKRTARTRAAAPTAGAVMKAVAVTGWTPGAPFSGAVTADGQMGCPECGAGLTLRAPSVPDIWKRRWVLACPANTQHLWVLEMRLARALVRKDD